MSDPTALPNLTPTSGQGGAAPAGGDGAEQPAEEPLGQRVQEALTSLGLEASTDDDGDVAFTFEEQQLFVRTDDGTNVMRVFGQWRLEEPVPTDDVERMSICNDVNVAFNLVKTAVANDTLLVTSEHILPRNADVRGLLGIAVPLVLQGVQVWHQRATGQVPGQEGEESAQGAQDGSAQPQPGQSGQSQG